MPKKQKIAEVDVDVGVEEVKIPKVENIKKNNDIFIQRDCKVLFQYDGYLYVKFNKNHDVKFPYKKTEYPEYVNVAYSGTFGKSDFVIIDIVVG